MSRLRQAEGKAKILMKSEEGSASSASHAIANWRSGGSGMAKLPHGRHGIDRDEVEASQRGRMLRACLEQIGRTGAVNVADIVRGALVSRKTFYEHFSSCEECVAEAVVTANLVIGAEMAAGIDRADPSDPLYKVRTLVADFCSMASEEPLIALAIVGTTYALEQPTKQAWLDITTARRAILMAYWDEARARDPKLAPTTTNRLTAAIAFMERFLLEQIAAVRESELPDLADELADSMVEIVGGLLLP